MIKGIGVDIVEIRRVEEIIERHGEKFLEKVFVQEEIDYSKAFRRPAVHFAARFAVKEAFRKAAGEDGMPYGWKEVWTRNDISGAPVLGLSSRLQKCFSGEVFHVSISHTDNNAVAVLIREAPS